MDYRPYSALFGAGYGRWSGKESTAACKGDICLNADLPRNASLSLSDPQLKEMLPNMTAKMSSSQMHGINVEKC